MYIERAELEHFEIAANNYKLVAVVGPRQAGKTTFLKEQVRKANGKFVKLDDPEAKALFDEDIKKFETQYIEGNTITGIDEVQYGKDAGPKLKYLADSDRRAWVSSSSQIILGKEVLSWLVGRVSIVKLFPFSFAELLVAHGQKETTTKIVERLEWEHCVYGGYPAVVLATGVDVKIMLLSNLRETMLLKDVARTFSIKDVVSLEAFSRYLAHSVGNALAYQVIGSELNLSFETVKKYLDAMEKSYLVARVEPFYSNKLKELVKQPKVYFLDTGLRNSVVNDFPTSLETRGKLFENYVFTELLKAGFQPKYWRSKTGAEVDFIIEKNNEVIPIEVKVTAPGKTIEKSMRTFIENYKPKKAFIVYHKGTPGTLKANNCKVTITNTQNLIEALKN